MEGGNRAIDAAHCWEFSSMDYTNNSSEVIEGQFSARTGTFKGKHQSLSSPYIINPEGAIVFKHRLSINDKPATIRLYVIIFDYATKQYDTNYLYTSYSTGDPTLPVISQFNIKRTGIFKIIFSFIGNQSNARGILDAISIPGLNHSNPSNACLPKTAMKDSDGDGVYDTFDDFPNDPLLAFNNYIKTNYSTFLFEDLWPGKGDFDFNDLVIDYRMNRITNANNKIVKVEAIFVLRAIGASYKNAFAFQMNQIPPSKILSISGQNLSESLFVLASNGTELGQKYAVVPVFDNAHKAIGYTGAGTGVNVEHSGPSAPYDTSSLLILLDTSGAGVSLSEFSFQAFNPFIVINQTRGRELHKIDFPPTDLMNRSLFFTEYDRSNPNTNKYYRSLQNVPWVIETSMSTAYMSEKNDLSSGYTKLIDWVMSSGSTYTDWYSNPVAGYRNSSKLF